MPILGAYMVPHPPLIALPHDGPRGDGHWMRLSPDGRRAGAAEQGLHGELLISRLRYLFILWRKRKRNGGRNTTYGIAFAQLL